MSFALVDYIYMYDEATRYLIRKDPRLRPIIRAAGPCTLKRGRRYFISLSKAIVSQQLSTKAARTIYGRFQGLFDRGTPTPASLLTIPVQSLRDVGLSRQKISYLLDLAEKFHSRQIPSSKFSTMDDEAVIRSLTAVRGIGVWTVQMFLIFELSRPDVLPVDDLGLRKAVQSLDGLENLPNPTYLYSRSEQWKPWRSIATWYLWRSLDSVPSA